MSPPIAQHPNLWPPHTQPLFSLANVISMAMSMAQSFIPPASLPAQGMPFHPQLPTPTLPQSGYPSVYPHHYPTPPVEVPHPTAGIPVQNSTYDGPEAAPQMEGLPATSRPTWLHPLSPPSVASTPPPVPQEPLQQVGYAGSLSTTRSPEDSPHSCVPTAQVPAQSEATLEFSGSNCHSAVSSPAPQSPESTVSPPPWFHSTCTWRTFKAHLEPNTYYCCE